jgi:SH3-like domain-containing protein
MEEDKGEVAQLTLRLREQNGEEMFFKVKGTTKMQKVFDSYTQRKGVAANSVRFMRDGVRIQAADTPKMLELEDSDQIDVMLEATGGNVDGEEGAAQNAAEQPITVKVRDQSGEEMFFKVKKGTAMKKIMQAFADRKGVALDVLRFNIDGARVNAEDTPKMLEMEDGDQIDVMMQQLGGGDNEGAAPSENLAEQPITVKVRDQSGEEMFFKVKKGTAMKKIMQAFADRKGVALDVLRFTIDGARVNAEDTPKMLEMEDGDQIDVMMQQLGGRS